MNCHTMLSCFRYFDHIFNYNLYFITNFRSQFYNNMHTIQFKIIYLDKKIVTKSLQIQNSFVLTSKLFKILASEIKLNFFKVYKIDPTTKIEIQLTQSCKFGLTDNIIIRQCAQSIYIEEQCELKNQEEFSQEKYSGSIVFDQRSNVLQEEESFMQSQPEISPYVYGFIKICRSLKCFYKEIYIELNPELCILNLFKQKKYYPKKPYLTIPMSNILRIKRLKKTPCFSNKSYLMIQYTQNTITFCFYDKDICSKWMKYLKNSLIFSKYYKARMSRCDISLSVHYQQNFKADGKIELVDSVATSSESESQNKKKSEKMEESQKQKSRSKLQDEDEEIKQSIARMKNSKISLTSNSPKKKIENSEFQEYVNQKEEIVLLEDFYIQKKIGNGGFGYVYLGMHKTTEVYYAIKQLNKNSLIQKRQLKNALTELQILKQTNNPFILKLFYAFQTKQNLYLVFTYCPNGTLKSLISETGGLSVEDSILYISEIILAIEYLHDKNILYRDLKPENILIDKDHHLLLCDFGLSKANMADNDKASSICGSPAYLSPQLLNNYSTTKMSDIYGIGAVFYQMLHGSPLFDSQNIGEMLERIKTQEPQINEDLPAEVIDFLKQTLQKNPEKRLRNLKEHKMFVNTNWKKVAKKMKDPFLMLNRQKKSSLNEIEITYKIDEDYNETNYIQDRVEGWSYSIKRKQQY